MEPVAHMKNSMIPNEVVDLAAKTEEALGRLPRVPAEIAEFLHDHGIACRRFELQRGAQCGPDVCH